MTRALIFAAQVAWPQLRLVEVGEAVPMRDAEIMLHCPDCDREMMAQRADTDPPTAAVARIQCDRCDDGDPHSPECYDAVGSWVDPVAHLQETCA